MECDLNTSDSTQGSKVHLYLSSVFILYTTFVGVCGVKARSTAVIVCMDILFTLAMDLNKTVSQYDCDDIKPD